MFSNQVFAGVFQGGMEIFKVGEATTTTADSPN
jgi:hypothetical protein